MGIQEKEFNNEVNNEEGGIDVKKLVSIFIGHWIVFVVGLAIFCTGAYLYTRYGVPSYKINSQILVDESHAGSAGDQVLKSSSVDFSDLFDMSSNSYNEIDILKSRLLMERTVRVLGLNVIVYSKGRIRSLETADEEPFTVKLITKVDSIKDRNYLVKIENDKIHLEDSKDNISVDAKFGEPIKLDQYDLVFFAKPGNLNPKGYQINVQSVDERVDDLMRSFDVQLTDKKSTTLALSFEYSNPKKGEKILQKLMDLYLLSNLQNKTQIADSTLKFIDGQLGKVTAELSGIEGDFTKFKEQNNLANVDQQGKALIDNVSTYQNKLSDLQVQLSLVNDIEKYIDAPNIKRIIPSSFAVPDPVFATAIGKYNDLLVERDKLALSYKDNNPVVQSIDDQIENVRTGLVKSFESYKQGLESTVKQAKAQNSSLDKQVATVPKKERVFLDYTREQNLKQDLYLYLLQKREETAIATTTTVISARKK
jgi:uncharacterized protein involved in exopolysaccharide biosynthesis